VHLSGSLADFTLLDLLALIQVTRRTGTLTLTRGERQLALHFREGILARGSETNGPRTLPEYLLARGVCQPAQLQGLPASLQVGEQTLAAALVDLCEVPRSAILEAVREETRRVLDEALLWDGGDFRFDPAATLAADDVVADLDLAPVIASAHRVVEERRALQTWLPSPESRLRLRTQLAHPQVTLTAEEWRLIAAIANGASLGDLALALRFDVARVRMLAKGLVDLGLVEVVPPTGGAAVTEQPAGRPSSPWSREFAAGVWPGPGYAEKLQGGARQ